MAPRGAVAVAGVIASQRAPDPSLGEGRAKRPPEGCEWSWGIMSGDLGRTVAASSVTSRTGGVGLLVR